MPSPQWTHFTEKLLLSNKIHEYKFVSQGKVDIPGVDDGEELLLTDVSPSLDNCSTDGY